jgi:hypothetical protein
LCSQLGSTGERHGWHAVKGEGRDMSDIDQDDLSIIGFAVIWKALAKEGLDVPPALREQLGKMMRGADKRMEPAKEKLREWIKMEAAK